MGNICRSPTAAGVFQRIASERAPELEIEVDSAGTHGYHVGEPPDQRAVRAAMRRGVDLREQRARQVQPSDFEHFDLLVAMDRLNREILLDRSPDPYRDRIRLLMEFTEAAEGEDVPDPYYGGPVGFEHVLDLAEEASKGLLDEILQRVDAGRR